MPLPFLIFILLPCLELILFAILGEVFGSSRTFAAAAALSLLGIVLFRLRRVGPGSRLARGVPPVLDSIIYRLGTVLLIIPGFLTGLAGLFLLFPPGRTVAYRRFLKKHSLNGLNSLPMSARLIALLFGVNPFGVFRGSDSGSARDGRTWNPYGHAETPSDGAVDDEDAATAYNSNISHPAFDEDDRDDDIIDVDYTVR
ncbi:MAG: FxsA family protein [Thermoguttaceae bacterium]